MVNRVVTVPVGNRPITAKGYSERVLQWKPAFKVPTMFDVENYSYDLHTIRAACEYGYQILKCRYDNTGNSGDLSNGCLYNTP